MAFNQKNSDFITKNRQTVRDGLDAILRAEAQVQEYQLLGLGDPATGITADDFAGDNADMTPSDLVAAISVFAAVQSALTANNNAGLKALLKAAR